MPLGDALTSPWALSRSRSVMSEAIRDGDSPLRATAHPRRVTVGGRGDLGLRSLAPAALFGARLTSFFETRRRLPTSATAYDVRARTSSSRDPRRDGRLDALPFLTPHASALAGAVRRGEPRKVHSRRPRCRFAWFSPRVPDRDTDSSAPPPASCPARIHSWRLTCTGPRTERRTCRLPAREMVRASRVRCIRGDARMRTTFPSSAAPGRPMSSVRPRAGEEPAAHRRTDQDLRSRVGPRRTTPSCKPGRLSPSRTREARTVWIAPHRLAPRRSLAHAAHTYSRGIGAFRGALQAPRDAVTREPWLSRDERLWDLAGLHVPGTDDPSTPAWLEQARPGGG
jgi:hypothetical protein